MTVCEGAEVRLSYGTKPGNKQNLVVYLTEGYFLSGQREREEKGGNLHNVLI